MRFIHTQPPQPPPPNTHSYSHRSLLGKHSLSSGWLSHVQGVYLERQPLQPFLLLFDLTSRVDTWTLSREVPGYRVGGALVERVSLPNDTKVCIWSFQEELFIRFDSFKCRVMIVKPVHYGL